MNPEQHIILEREEKWLALRQKLKEQFGRAPDLNAILLLIGINELGAGQRKFSKEEKQDLMHIATCTVLSHSGYYKFSGYDEDGWPHFEISKPLPVMNLTEQEDFLRDHVILYFDEMNF